MYVGRSSRKNLIIERRQARNNSGYVPGSLDESSRSVEVVAATQAPSDVYDPARWEMVSEVLLMSGCQLPEDGQVPLTVEHERGARAVIGSLREVRINDDQLVGRVYFSTSDDAKPFWVKVREGHLNRFSVTYPVSDRDSVYIAENETAEVEGQRYEGPILVTKKWTPKALGLVLFPADKNAKARNERKEFTEMKPEKQQSIEDVQRAERERVLEITAMCKRFGCEDLTKNMVNESVSLENAQQQVMDRLSSGPEAAVARHFPEYGTAGRLGEDASDKRQAAIIDGLALRAGVNIDTPAPGANEYRETPLTDIARECLLDGGTRVTGMSRTQIVKEALVQRAAMTSGFPALMAATANKVLSASFVEAPSTYQNWVKQTSGRDFKEMSRNQVSEAPELDQVLELGQYTYGELSDAKEVFQIHKFGKLFAISREAIINDDLSALTNIPKSFALSAKRKINQSVYDVLIANDAMSDEIPLFHDGHSNLNSGAAGVPSETTLSDARLAMRKQTGLANAILNIGPKHLIAPAALETDIDVLLNSLASTNDNKNSQVKNPFHGKLEPVIEAYLDATSATAWYLVASHGAIDTIELCFLHGRKEPYLETRNGWQVDGLEYKVRIEFGVKAIDWRGLQKNDGTA